MEVVLVGFKYLFVRVWFNFCWDWGAWSSI